MISPWHSNLGVDDFLLVIGPWHSDLGTTITQNKTTQSVSPRPKPRKNTSNLRVSKSSTLGEVVWRLVFGIYISDLRKFSWCLMIGSQSSALSKVVWWLIIHSWSSAIGKDIWCLVIGFKELGPWQNELVLGDWLSGARPSAKWIGVQWLALRSSALDEVDWHSVISSQDLNLRWFGVTLSDLCLPLSTRTS